MRVITWLFSVWLLGLAATAGAATLNYTTYYHNDHLGSPVAATDERGGLLWRAHFRPYGERQEDPKDAAFGAVGYTGHAQDNDSGLVYAGARYMDPVLGRFMAVDPVGFQTSNPLSFNRYAYGSNNPQKYVDPDGRIIETAWDIASIAMGVASAGANIAAGNYGSAAVDSLGVIIDTGAMLVPGVPGGAGAGIKALRAADKVADVTKRPGSFRKKPVKDSWDNAVDGKKPDSKECPTCGNDVFGNPHKGEKRNGADGWDNDHQPKWKDRDLTGMDRKQVLDEFNKNTQLRCPSCNRADNQ